MIKKLTITGIWRKTTDKEGNPLKSKKGNAYEKVSIKTQEYGDEFIGGFGGEWNKNWKEGEEVTLDITESEYNGKKYKNFSRVNMTERMMEMIMELRSRLDRVEYSIKNFNEKGFLYPTEKPEQPNFAPKDETKDAYDKELDALAGDEPPIESLDSPEWQ